MGVRQYDNRASSVPSVPSVLEFWTISRFCNVCPSYAGQDDGAGWCSLIMTVWQKGASRTMSIDVP